MFSCSEFQHHYQKSFFKYTEPLSEDYRVWINGREIPVYTCRISKYPFNRVWPGFQRPMDQTEPASYVNLVSDEELRVEVATGLTHDRILLKPYSKNIPAAVKDGRISFTLKQTGQFVLECGSNHHCLYLFNSPPITVPDPSTITHYFGPGIHFPGKLTLQNNDSVYVDKDALVFGCIYAENAKNIRIFGNGVLDDSHEERTGNYCYENYINGNLKFYDCENLTVRGVLLKNSAIWCVNLFHCFHVTLDNIKVFGQWRYNTDGIDIVNSQEIQIQNSFIHSFDDTITIKGIDRYASTDNRNIFIDNCVLWCDWGKCCEVGVETACREYRNICFRNCDVLRGGNAALDINNGDCAEISEVAFEDIRVEFNAFDTREVYQTRDEMEYDPGEGYYVPALLRINNSLWRTEACKKIWNLPDLTDTLDLTGISLRGIHDVTVRNIHVYYDPLLPLEEGKPDVRLYMESHQPDAYYNIQIEDIYVNGKKAVEKDLFLVVKNVKDFTIR